MPGTGLFLISLSRRGIPILPCSICEEENVLTARFGPPFSIDLPETAAKGERDSLAREASDGAHRPFAAPEYVGRPYTLAVEQLLASGPVA